jgi:sulfur relay (sulfurtransferase) complex TusBCD TusD component (DsrE family)
MNNKTVLLFTRNGMGDGPSDLQINLIKKFLQLALENTEIPAKMLFYTDGVKLACKGSEVIDLLKQLEEKGVELVLCSTCLQRFELSDMVEAGVVGSMADIIEALSKSEKVISL